MYPRCAKRLHARSLKLNAQRQSAENIVKLARNLRFPSAPTRRSRERLDIISTVRVWMINHHGQRVSALVSGLLAYHLLEHTRKEILFQVTGIESNRAQHISIFGKPG